MEATICFAKFISRESPYQFPESGLLGHGEYSVKLPVPLRASAVIPNQNKGAGEVSSILSLTSY